uniref:thioesterase domain-containing protein n=1 Tax=Nocardia farcinica TaxID=37329 RepID=UPI002457A9D7
GLHSPHDSGAAGFADKTEAAEHNQAAIRSIPPHGPYHLLGWSLGGHIAHEMAVQLRAEGEEVALLAAGAAPRRAGRPPPGRIRQPCSRPRIWSISACWPSMIC